MPRFDLLDLSAYRSMAIQTSRGCPHGCEFCDIWRRFGRRPRYKSIPRVLAELTELHRLGWRSSIFVVDDNFVGNPKQANALLKSIADWQHERNHPFDFSTEAALTLADDEALLSQMAASGFDMVFIGLESPNEESLRETHKSVNVSGQMNRCVRRIQEAGIQVTAGFILGFDHDPDDIADQMIDFINELSIPVAMVGLLMALPETDLHERLEREGRLRQAADGNNTHEFSLNFTPQRPEADLIADYKRVLQALYPEDLKSYFDRCAGLRERWIPVRQKKRAIRWFEVVWLLRYVFRSIFTIYAWNSTRFLLKTLWSEPRFFPTAVSLGIQGHHFREITRLAFRLDELKQTYAALIKRYVARFQRERKAFQVYADDGINEGRAALSRHANAVLTAAERYRTALLDIAQDHLKRLSRKGEKEARPIYDSFRHELDRVADALRQTVKEDEHV